MKSIFKKGATLLIVGAALCLTSCYETRYVHYNNHHTERWYHRRNTPPPSSVNFELDVHRRR